MLYVYFIHQLEPIISWFLFYESVSLSGTAAAAQGATDKDKANAAAERIFTLIDHPTNIDPLSKDGKKVD